MKRLFPLLFLLMGLNSFGAPYHLKLPELETDSEVLFQEAVRNGDLEESRKNFRKYNWGFVAGGRFVNVVLGDRKPFNEHGVGDKLEVYVYNKEDPNSFGARFVKDFYENGKRPNWRVRIGPHDLEEFRGWSHERVMGYAAGLAMAGWRPFAKE